MPPKKSLCISVTVRPRDGIDQKEVAALSHWVTELKKLKASAAVIEKPNTNEAHCHIALLFEDQTTGQNIAKRLETVFKSEITAGGRWEHPRVAIVCRAHTSFAGLVGGYFTKEEDHQKLWMNGITQDELDKGKQERDQAIAKQKKKNCSVSNLIYELRDIYDELDQQHPLSSWKLDHPNGATAQECLEELLLRGKLNYLIHWGKMKKSIEANWVTIIASERE